MKRYASEEVLDLLERAKMLQTENICFTAKNRSSTVVIALNQTTLAIGRFTRNKDGSTNESWTPTLHPQAYTELLTALNMAQGQQHGTQVVFQLLYPLEDGSDLGLIHGYCLFDSFDTGSLTLFVQSRPFTVQITPVRLNLLRNFLNQVVRTISV